MQFSEATANQFVFVGDIESPAELTHQYNLQREQMEERGVSYNTFISPDLREFLIGHRTFVRGWYLPKTIHTEIL